MNEEITLEYLAKTDTALSKILNSLSEGACIVMPDREVICGTEVLKSARAIQRQKFVG